MDLREGEGRHGKFDTVTYAVIGNVYNEGMSCCLWGGIILLREKSGGSLTINHGLHIFL